MVFNSDLQVSTVSDLLLLSALISYSFIPLQPHMPPCCYSNLPARLSSQDLFLSAVLLSKMLCPQGPLFTSCGTFSHMAFSVRPFPTTLSKISTLLSLTPLISLLCLLFWSLSSDTNTHAHVRTHTHTGLGWMDRF